MVIIFAVLLYYLNSREGKTWTGLEHWLLQCQWNVVCSTSWAIRPTGSWSLCGSMIIDQPVDEGVPSLRAEHSSVCQRNMDSILTPRVKCLPLVQSQMKHLALGRHVKHVCHPRPETPALARERVQNGRWPHPQGHPGMKSSSQESGQLAGPPCAIRMSVQEGPIELEA